MGLEINCKGIVSGNEYQGRLHVDSKEIKFTCADAKWNHPVGSDVTAKVNDGVLQVGSGKKSARFELGSDAEKWLEKILNPPSRMKKLGIKAGQKIFLQGSFPTEFEEEIEKAGAEIASSLSHCTLLIALVESFQELTALKKPVGKLETGMSVWVVWPKGETAVTQNQVIDFGKSLGTGPGKSCAFDERLTAMRFTLK